MQQTHYRPYLKLLWGYLLLLPQCTFAQLKQRGVADSNWRQLTSDPAFYYRNELENAGQRTEQANAIFRIIAQFFKFLNSGPGHATIAIVAIAILSFAVYKILQSGQISFKREKKAQEAINEEEDISRSDWERSLQEAMKAGEIRMAVRYGYMWLLQLLEKRDLIQYRSDKTNYDYYTELEAGPHRKMFRELSRTYEYAWYGHHDVSENELTTYMELFNTFKKQLT